MLREVSAEPRVPITDSWTVGLATAVTLRERALDMRGRLK
jgi:hypothetical protein